MYFFFSLTEGFSGFGPLLERRVDHTDYVLMIIFLTVREAGASVGHVVFLTTFDDCLNIIQGTDAKRYHSYSYNHLQQDSVMSIIIHGPIHRL